MGSISEQFVMYTAVLNICSLFIVNFVNYVFKNSYFSCGLPINSFWFSGVSLKNYLILLLNTKERLRFSVIFARRRI